MSELKEISEDVKIDGSSQNQEEETKNTTQKKSSPFLSTESAEIDHEEKSNKKNSPFLSTDVIEREEEEEETTIIKQHDQIDNAVGKNAVFNRVGKLYFLSKKTGKLETRGEGKIIIVADQNGLYKVLMIRDKVMLKGCNHYIAASCPLVKATQVKNSWVWTALNDKSDAEKNEDKTTYFATFKNEEDASLFNEKYNYGLKENVKKINSLKNQENKD